MKNNTKMLINEFCENDSKAVNVFKLFNNDLATINNVYEKIENESLHKTFILDSKLSEVIFYLKNRMAIESFMSTVDSDDTHFSLTEKVNSYIASIVENFIIHYVS